MSDTDAVDSDSSRADSVITRKDLAASQGRQDRRIDAQFADVTRQLDDLDCLMRNARAYSSWDDIYPKRMCPADNNGDVSPGPFPNKVLKFWQLQHNHVQLAKWLRFYSVDDWQYWHLDPDGEDDSDGSGSGGDSDSDSDSTNKGYETLDEAVSARPLIALARMANKLGLDMGRITESMKNWDEAQRRRCFTTKTRKRESARDASKESQEMQRPNKRANTAGSTHASQLKSQARHLSLRQAPIVPVSDYSSQGCSSPAAPELSGIVPETVLASPHHKPSTSHDAKPTTPDSRIIHHHRLAPEHGAPMLLPGAALSGTTVPDATSPRPAFHAPLSLPPDPADVVSSSSAAESLSTLALAGYSKPPSADNHSSGQESHQGAI